MKIPLIVALAFISWNVSFVSAADPAKAPDLKGTWVAEYPVSFHHGSGHSKQTLIITAQNAQGFRGVREWTRTDFTPGPKGREPALETSKVPFAGVIGFDGKTLHIADQGQSSFMTGKLVKPDVMELYFVMSGDPAIAFRAKFKRVKP